MGQVGSGETGLQDLLSEAACSACLCSARLGLGCSSQVRLLVLRCQMTLLQCSVPAQERMLLPWAGHRACQLRSTCCLAGSQPPLGTEWSL